MNHRTVPLCFSILLLAVLLLVATANAAERGKPSGGYAVVVSKRTKIDPRWARVVGTLARKYRADVVVYDGDVAEALEPLQKAFPRYVCFVARPEEANREFVVKVHRLTRKLDDDPYTDVVWGILTGYKAADALRIVNTRKPLIVRKAAGGTGINLNLFDEGIWYSEGHKNAYTEKKRGGKPEKKTGPEDSTQALVGVLNKYQPDVFVTSGHATDRDWQIGYPPHKKGQFRCKDGVLVAIDLKGRAYVIQSKNPKIYLPVGNCLMGRIRDKQAMALAWMGSGGVNQMMGYVVSTWYGKGGWGTRDWFFAEPGRYCLSDAFYFNNQSIVHRLETQFPKTARKNIDRWNIETDRTLLPKLAQSLGYPGWNDKVKENVGLLWDRDTVAFYGDPAWEARLAPRELPFEKELTFKDDIYTFRITANKDCKPSRGPAMFLPHRVEDIKILEGQALSPLITDNFIMLTKPGEFKQGKTYEVVFRAKKI